VAISFAGCAVKIATVLYVNMSVLVAALTTEAETQRMQEWLAAQSADGLFVSDWAITEFSSALSISAEDASV
jgi:uncharacterized protein